jgi:hypothetical protein
MGRLSCPRAGGAAGTGRFSGDGSGAAAGSGRSFDAAVALSIVSRANRYTCRSSSLDGNHEESSCR